MKLLQPLGVVVVRLTARHDFEVARIDQVDADGGRLEHLVDRDPVDAGRFHRDGIDVVVEQPGHQLPRSRVNVVKVRTTVTSRSGGHDLGIANVETGRVRKDGRQVVDPETGGLGMDHLAGCGVSPPDCERTVAY